MYPERYQLPALTDHLLGLLERTRLGLEAFDEKALTEQARAELWQAQRQFAEITHDPSYWERIEGAFFRVALPRYLLLAKEQHALEHKRYGLWRGGDLVSRVAYGAAGLLLALVVWRFPIPKIVELLPVLFFILGPMIPEMQVSFMRRRYSKALTALVADMSREQKELLSYRPLAELVGDTSPASPQSSTKERT